VRRCIKALGIEEVLTAPRSPWRNPYAEHLIGSLRRELLDHVIVLSERHLKLKGNSPEARAVEPRERGRVIAEPRVGGLHHRYRRVG
jgi:hypothetical protein